MKTTILYTVNTFLPKELVVETVGGLFNDSGYVTVCKWEVK